MDDDEADAKSSRHLRQSGGQGQNYSDEEDDGPEQAPGSAEKKPASDGSDSSETTDSDADDAPKATPKRGKRAAFEKGGEAGSSAKRGAAGVGDAETGAFDAQARRWSYLLVTGAEDRKLLMAEMVEACAKDVVIKQVRETPCRPRSWANSSLFLAVLPQECTGQLASFGPA